MIWSGNDCTAGRPFSARHTFHSQIADDCLLLSGTLLKSSELVHFPKYQALLSISHSQRRSVVSESFAKQSFCLPYIKLFVSDAVQSERLAQSQQFRNKAREKCHEASILMIVISFCITFDNFFQTKIGGTIMRVVRQNVLFISH